MWGGLDWGVRARNFVHAEKKGREGDSPSPTPPIKTKLSTIWKTLGLLHYVKRFCNSFELNLCYPL